MRWEFLLSAIVITACSTSQPVAPPSKPQAPTSPAAVEKSATTAALGEPMKKKDGTTVYCRRESVTNTRLRDRKVCLTKEEWAARTDSATEAFNDANKQPMPPRE